MASRMASCSSVRLKAEDSMTLMGPYPESMCWGLVCVQ